MNAPTMARVFRVAVAEGSGAACPPLGRALRFAVFDVEQGRVRGPVYRVRHDNPGESCDQHAELLALVQDCQCVIAGSVGPRLGQRLRDAGMRVVATTDAGPSATLVERLVAGCLSRMDEAGQPSQPARTGANETRTTYGNHDNAITAEIKCRGNPSPL